MIILTFEQYCNNNRIKLTNHQTVMAEVITLENVNSMYNFIEQRATGKTFLFNHLKKFLHNDFKYVESNPYIIKNPT